MQSSAVATPSHSSSVKYIPPFMFLAKAAYYLILHYIAGTPEYATPISFLELLSLSTVGTTAPDINPPHLILLVLTYRCMV